MIGQWETLESGPADAERTVLLLPGGLNTARSYAELMAQPGLAGVRLVAVTLPGHGGTPPPEDFRIEHYARLAAELAGDLGCDVVAGSASAPPSRLRWPRRARSRGRWCSWHQAFRSRTSRPSCASWTASAVR